MFHPGKSGDGPPTRLRGFTGGVPPIDGPPWGFWPTGGAWLCQHLWYRYEFSGDRQYLARVYPTLKSASEFFLDTLVEHPTKKWLVTCPSLSPENVHPGGTSICAGPTMDMGIIRDLFTITASSARALSVDEPFAAQVMATRARLAPFQIGKVGQLQEWLDDWDVEAAEQHHRHVSHLYALFPSTQISPFDTPDLAKAARKTLEMRGDNGTGWSLAWKLNWWPRLLDGEHSYTILKMLLDPEHTYPNLFDAHPPFQIDGNFGGCNGIIEMLLQSQRGELHLLPALPKAWANGMVKGLRARGGFEVDIAWRNGFLNAARITSQSGKRCTVRIGERVTSFATVAGRSYVVDPSGNAVKQ